MQEGWRSGLPSGAMVSAAFSPPGPVTIASVGARLGRHCWAATRPRSGHSRQGWKPLVKTGEARLDAQHDSPARGACPRAGATVVSLMMVCR